MSLGAGGTAGRASRVSGRRSRPSGGGGRGQRLCGRHSARVQRICGWHGARHRRETRIAIRHELNDALRVEGGHIGYDTVPSFRGRGVATAMLREALPVARALGLTEVLLTCDDTNSASIRVIERNGGCLRETKDLAKNRSLKRYYGIPLPAPNHR